MEEIRDAGADRGEETRADRSPRRGRVIFRQLPPPGCPSLPPFSPKPFPLLISWCSGVGKTINYAVKWGSTRSGKERRATAIPDRSQTKMVINKARGPLLERPPPTHARPGRWCAGFVLAAGPRPVYGQMDFFTLPGLTLTSDSTRRQPPRGLASLSQFSFSLWYGDALQMAPALRAP